MTNLDLYKEILSKIGPGDFDNEGVPEKMDLWIEMDGVMIEHWVNSKFSATSTSSKDNSNVLIKNCIRLKCVSF